MVRDNPSTDAETGKYAPVLVNIYTHTGEESAPLLFKMHTRQSFADEIKKYEANNFRENVELGVRAATFLLIASLPFLPHKRNDLEGFSHVYSPWTVIMFAYTFYRTTGETLKLAKEGMLGTCLASLLIWVMFTIEPTGMTHKSSPMEFFIWTSVGVIFVVIILLLNLSVNTQIFATSYFAGFWMTFMSPDLAVDSYGHLLSMKPYGVAMSAIFTSFSGCCFAVLATLLPHPILARDQARQTANEVAVKLALSWESAHIYYSGSRINDYELDRLLTSVQRLQEMAATLATQSENSMMECFGRGRWHKECFMVNRVNRTLLEALERLHAMLIHWQREACSSVHEDFMKALQNDAYEVSSCSWHLCALVVRTVCGGEFSDSTKDQLEYYIESLQAHVASFTVKFNEQKQKMDKLGIHEELLGEHNYGLNLCATARLAYELADDILAIDAGQVIMPPEYGMTIRKFFDIRFNFSHEHLSFTLRNALSILVAFLLGYFGIGYSGNSKMIQSSNAGIASTCGLMLSQFIGSALIRNLSRLQGLVLGTVIGQMMYAILGYCTILSLALMGATIWLWSAGMMFLYFHSVKYSSIGCFLTVFGLQSLLQGCNEVFDPKNKYNVIVNAVLAIAIIIIVDLLFAWGRAAEKAYAAYVTAYDEIRSLWHQVLSPQELKTSKIPVSVTQTLSTALMLGAEADEEPRYWRTPWRSRLFGLYVDTTNNIRVILGNLSYAASEQSRLGRHKRNMYLSITQIQGFQDVLETTMTKLDLMKTLSAIFMHETPSIFKPLLDDENYCNLALVQHRNLRNLIHTLNAQHLSGINKSIVTLEEDFSCVASVLIMSLKAAMSELRALQHKVVQDR